MDRQRARFATVAGDIAMTPWRALALAAGGIGAGAAINVWIARSSRRAFDRISSHIRMPLDHGGTDSDVQIRSVDPDGVVRGHIIRGGEAAS